MNLDELKEDYGAEYPDAVMCDSTRMPLVKNGRFMREYESADQAQGAWMSRFMDGSASITAKELKLEWPDWDENLRCEFSQACPWLHKQPDFPDMLRFIMEHGGYYNWSHIALSVASSLPKDEAFDLLLRALHTVEVGKGCNFGQAIAVTKHPRAEAALRRRLKSVLEHDSLWDDDDFNNWAAYEATTTIENLIELGTSPAGFESQVRQLSKHVCSGNRNSCRNFLSKHYSWLT